MHRATRTVVTADPERQLDVQRFGGWWIRYALVLVVFWIGCLKFTPYESMGVFRYMSNSPWLSWIYHVFDVRNLSRAIGAVEIIIALLLAVRPISPRLSVVGSVGGIVMFLTTLSFLFTTPGVLQPGYGFPFLAGAPGQFLLKDTILLGVSIWTLGESLNALRTGSGNWREMEAEQKASSERRRDA